MPHSPRRRRHVLAALALLIAAPLAARAHVGDHASVHDTVASVVERMRRDLTPTALASLTVARVEQFLTDAEKETLGTEHISFTANIAITVFVLRDKASGDAPFWLPLRGFSRRDAEATVASRTFEVWAKPFEVGWVGLGVVSLSGGGEHYFIAVAPQKAGASVQLTDIYPGTHTVGVLKVGEAPYTDRSETLEAVPAELDGQVLLRGTRGRRDDARLTNLFRLTRHPSSKKPDQVVLTWAGNPQTTQAIQWRTSTEVPTGAVLYQRKSDRNRFDPRKPMIAKAETKRLETPDIANDPVVHRHTAFLYHLEPGTTYVYAVGDGSDDGWGELEEFTTAPAGTEPFSFIYMGDAQNGLDRWGSLIHGAYRDRPDAAFYVMAGDIVNRGAERDDWDDLFHNAKGVYDRRQLVPAIGNHEYQGGAPKLYLDLLAVRGNGPADMEPEHAYSFEYSNALFVVLDSNRSAESQAAWLEEQLASSKATWKFVTYHHPAYSSAPNRDNKSIREVWGALFDKYHVDMALQGHDHAYLRTYPMKDGKRVESTKEGTVYIVSVSGTKMYSQDPRDYTEFGMTNVSTYQVLDIQISGDRLVYRAYDIDGNLRDSIVIEK